MNKLSVLAMIGGAALLTAVPVSLQWSQEGVSLSLDRADARIGRPLTPLSVAGVHRRAYRRAAYAGAVGVGAYGVGRYYGGYGYGYPAYSYGYGYPAYGYSYASPRYGYGYGYPGYRAARRVAIHRARWH